MVFNFWCLGRAVLWRIYLSKRPQPSSEYPLHRYANPGSRSRTHDRAPLESPVASIRAVRKEERHQLWVQLPLLSENWFERSASHAFKAG